MRGGRHFFVFEKYIASLHFSHRPCSHKMSVWQAAFPVEICMVCGIQCQVYIHHLVLSIYLAKVRNPGPKGPLLALLNTSERGPILLYESIRAMLPYSVRPSEFEQRQIKSRGIKVTLAGGKS